jgi:hypothetical protein
MDALLYRSEVTENNQYHHHDTDDRANVAGR